MNLHQLVNEKFTSGNSVPVERITITRAEYEAMTPGVPPLSEEEVLSLLIASKAVAGMIHSCGASAKEKDALSGVFNVFAAKSLEAIVSHSGVDVKDLLKQADASFWGHISRNSTKQ